MYKAYKYRIYPTKDQRMVIEKHFGGCRFIYNLALETKITSYKSGLKLSAYDLQKQLTDLKKDVKWLYDINNQSLQIEFQNLDSAYKKFFTGAGFPKFKNKHGHKSYDCVNGLKLIDGRLKIPKIKETIKVSFSRQIEGKIKRATISKTPTGKYFVSILVDDGKKLPKKKKITEKKSIGIDLGIKDFLVTSDEHKEFNPKFLREKIDRLKILQRRASKKKKGSTNRKKSNLRVAKLHETIANKRTDFLQKLSTKMVSENQVTTFFVESLAVKNLVKNHKLAQAISDVSWSEFLRMLEYKCDWKGLNFRKIGRFEASSKTCFNCKEKNESLTLSDRSWVCKNCGVTHDRDINAAKNIKFMGLNSGGANPEEPVEQRTLVRAKKQEVLYLNG